MSTGPSLGAEGVDRVLRFPLVVGTGVVGDRACDQHDNAEMPQEFGGEVSALRKESSHLRGLRGRGVRNVIVVASGDTLSGEEITKVPFLGAADFRVECSMDSSLEVTR